MNNKQNLHTHTTYADGKDTPEELVLKAIEKNLASIGFSEHSYLCYSTYPNQLTVNKMERYKREIRELKRKYKGKIDIFCGLEYDFYSDVDTNGFDYLIGSVHYLDCNGDILTFDRGLKETCDYVRENFGSSGLTFAKKYFETVACLAERKKIDIIGHFDLITKTNEVGKIIDTSDKQYLDLGYEAIHSLKGKIPFFEVNTGAISRGYRSLPYPQIEFLKEFGKCGFGAVITSDCHDKNFIDDHFEEAKELLLAAGFASKYILTDGGFEEVGL
ncbi:MAG: histidinol-phosphatase HisJ family protein [Lachnospiraceae bacterium]|nr:histidinol-phosphatase HisJ family protein [Lachnospiraceae bacterium]